MVKLGNTVNQRQPSARVQHKREQARKEILQVAQTLLRKGGVEAVTLASVAGELSMTKQSLYHYFSSKEALVRSLVTTLLDDEIRALTAAVEASGTIENTLSTLIRAFYVHYIKNIDAFRVIYCQSQLFAAQNERIDEQTLRDEINPRTRHLFDILEKRMISGDAGREERLRVRQIAFVAWSSALGLLTMLGIADANNDPLIHSDEALLDALSNVFDSASAHSCLDT
jgi:AcrR family transcriptional regulator